jgi:hypothetical protein
MELARSWVSCTWPATQIKQSLVSTLQNISSEHENCEINFDVKAAKIIHNTLGLITGILKTSLKGKRKKGLIAAKLVQLNKLVDIQVLKKKMTIKNLDLERGFALLEKYEGVAEFKLIDHSWRDIINVILSKLDLQYLEPLVYTQILNSKKKYPISRQIYSCVKALCIKRNIPCVFDSKIKIYKWKLSRPI